MEKKVESVLLLTNSDVKEILTVGTCIEAMRSALDQLVRGEAVNQPRIHTYMPASEDSSVYRLKLFIGGLQRQSVMDLRILSDMTGSTASRERGKRRLGLNLLFRTRDGALVAIIHDSYLQKLRVGAESAIASDYLARKDADVVGLLGSGWQAGAQIEALTQIRRIRAIRVFSPNEDHRRTFAERMTEKLGIAVKPVDTPRAAVKGAHVVVAATNSSKPVLEGKWLEPGVHVVSIVNSDKYVPRRELDNDTIARCDLLVISAKDQVMSDEPRDIYEPLTLGLIDWSKIFSIEDLISGSCSGRASEDQITVLKNSGMSIQFAAVGAEVFRLAKEKRIGREIPREWLVEQVRESGDE